MHIEFINRKMPKLIPSAALLALFAIALINILPAASNSKPQQAKCMSPDAEVCLLLLH
jgi:hypothetical protein